MNWRKIKAEYIAGGISQRALAEKYGVSASNLMRRANREEWNKRRLAAESKAIANTEQKTADAVADNAVLLERIKNKLLLKLSGMIDGYPDTNAVEMRERIGHTDYIYRMKDIAAIYTALEDKTAAGKNADIEDLSPLTELLRDE